MRKGTKKTSRFSLKMKRKLLLFFVLIVVALIALIGRLTYINAEKNEEYTKQVLAQQGYDSQTIPYRRGDITDCNGTVLATSSKVYNLIFDCKVLNTDTDAQEDTIACLVQCFPELSAGELRQLLIDYPSSQYRVLLKKLSYEKIQDFVQMQNGEIRKTIYKEDGTKGEIDYDIAGVWFETEYLRTYPYKTLAANVIGFSASDGSGINGLENYYNDELTGTNGRKYGYLNSDSNLEINVMNAINGNTIQTTIDANVQSIIEDIIINFNETYRDNFTEGPGSAHTSVLVMNPNTGAIIANAQYPSFDLSNPRDLTGYYTLEEIDEMTEEEQYDALNGLWTNFAVTTTYEPGSTGKPFTIAAGLESGVLTGNETFYCDGGMEIADYYVSCMHVHGMLTLGQSLAESCNDALMQIGLMEGAELFTQYQRIFGFGLKTNVDIVGETRTDTLVYKADDMIDVSLATNAFGQNYNVTQMQLCSAFCSLVNGGNLYRPYYVQKIIDEDGNTVSDTQPTLLKKTISEETGEIMKDYLRLVVTDGTGWRVDLDGYNVGGKTGTAEKTPRWQQKYLVSFIGAVPIDDPQIVLYVVVDEFNAEDQAQSSVPTQLAHDILEAILPYLNIYPTTTEGVE